MQKVEALERSSSLVLPVHVGIFLQELRTYIQWADQNEKAVAQALGQPVVMRT
jgi:hypothetical protein